MKKIVLILLAILMVTTLALGLAACKSDCDAGNHVWDEGTQTKAPNCTEVGKMVYKCTVCDHGEKVVDIPVNDNHVPKNVAVAPTCVADGTTAATQCQLCGATIAAGTKIPALGHDWAYAQFSADAEQHVKFCRRDGCGHNQMEDHISVANPSGGTKCSLCDKVLSGGVFCPHPNKVISDIPATCTTADVKRWVCPDCDWHEDLTVGKPLGHDYTGADWEPSTTAGKHVRTCTREGCGYKDRADHTPVVVKGTPATCTAAGTADGSKCSTCNAVIVECAPIKALGHSWSRAWSSNGTQHWHGCTREGCEAIDAESKADHNFGEDGHDLTCAVCDTPRPGENYVLTYTIGGEEVQQSYRRLADAIEFIAENQDVDNVIINVNDDDKQLEGLGVAIPGGLTITIDLHGSTYIIASNPVGSTGTETNGFQILAGSNITIKNGTITSEKGSGVKMLIQNYANLTLDGVTLDGRNLDASAAPNYTLSNNCGTINISNQSVIIAREENGVALDVWYNMGGRYPEGVFVTVGKTCTISGVIEYGSAQADVADLATKAVLTLPAGEWSLRYSANVTDCRATGITIDGKKLTAQFGEWTTVKEPTCTEEGLKEHSCMLCKRPESEAIPTIAHTIKTAEYIGGHQHEGICTVCGNKATGACNEENLACTVCGRELYVIKNDVVTIDTSKQGYDNQQEVTKITSGDIEVSLDANGNSNTPKYFDKGTAVRLYADGIMTISVPDKTVITKITFTFDSGDDKNTIMVDGGEFNGTVWTGSANSVKFTIGGDKGHRRFQTITVEYSYEECNHFLPDEWTTTEDETCTENGKERRDCMDCDYFETREILAHHFLGEWVEPKDADCKNEENGYKAHYECEACGKYFTDKDASNEVDWDDDLVIAWAHDCVFHDREAPEKDKNGTRAYYECNYCGKVFADAECKIQKGDSKDDEEFKKWAVIEYTCAHTNRSWQLYTGTGDYQGEHVYICECGEDASITGHHAPAAGTWSGTDVHAQSCSGATENDKEACTIHYAEHKADYAKDYTVSTEGDKTYHAKVCGNGCGLVDDKHEADLGNFVPVDGDSSHHHKTCKHEGCNYTAELDVHGYGNYVYVSEGQHKGTCVCGATVIEKCTPKGDNNACRDCGRIVGTVNNGGTDTLTAPAKTITSNTSADKLTYVSGKVTLVLTQNNSTKNGFDNTELRFYQSNVLTISVPNGYITTIVLTGTDTGKKAQGNLTVAPASVTTAYTSNGLTLTINNNDATVNEITITASSQVRLTSITVTYTAASPCYHEGDNVLVEKTVASADCEHDGIKKDCYYCTACDTYFATDACTESLNKNDVVIDKLGHDYQERKQCPATCIQEQYFADHFYCDQCKQYFDAGKNVVNKSQVVGSTATHTWSEWEENKGEDAGTHTRICSFGVHTETGDCTFDADAWVYDDTTHWHVCPTCKHAFEKEDDGYDFHDEDGDNGKCSVCGYNPKAVSVSVEVDGGAASLVTTKLPLQAEVGTAVTFTVTVADGYRLVSVEDFWTETLIEAVDGTYTYTFTEDSVYDGAVTVNITIIKQVTVNIADVENGSIAVTYGEGENATTVTSGDKVDVGTTLTITVSPSQGYQVKSITAGGAPVTPDDNGKYTVSINTTMTDITVSAETELIPAKDYKKVTSLPTDLSKYKFLIVCEDQKVYFDGSLDNKGLDCGNNKNHNYKDIEIVSNAIQSTDELNAATFTIDSNGNIKSASGYYISGKSATGNGLTAATTATSNTISFDSKGNIEIKCVSGDNYTILCFNTTADTATAQNTRFRFYKHTTYPSNTSYKAIQLYAMEITE